MPPGSHPARFNVGADCFSTVPSAAASSNHEDHSYWFCSTREPHSKRRLLL